MQRLFFFKVTQSVADFNPQAETAFSPRRKNLFFLPYRHQVTPQAARSVTAFPEKSLLFSGDVVAARQRA
ncbi:MAG: hypothetical protein J6A07_01905 [Firmicutes bacterium]|nr:hypothetical protein [Bacillota bacterium]